MAKARARRTKVKTPKPAWREQHEKSGKRLLKAEAQSLAKMRAEARQIHAKLLQSMGGTKAQALRALKGARAQMAQVISDSIQATRVRARDAALDQARSELGVLTKQLRAKGLDVPELKHRVVGSAGEISASASAADVAAADAVGHAFASRWSQNVMAHLVNVKKGVTSTDIEYKAKLAMMHMDHQVRRIAVTETAKAYNDQHRESMTDALGETEGSEALEAGAAPVESAAEGEAAEGVDLEAAAWRKDVYKYWNAVLDRKTCADCRDHDGEVAPIGTEFLHGDIPGWVHVYCRCIETLVTL